MSTIPGLNILFWMLLWLTAMALIKIKFSDSTGFMGSLARALGVIM